MGAEAEGSAAEVQVAARAVEAAQALHAALTALAEGSGSGSSGAPEASIAVALKTSRHDPACMPTSPPDCNDEALPTAVVHCSLTQRPLHRCHLHQHRARLLGHACSLHACPISHIHV